MRSWSGPALLVSDSEKIKQAFEAVLDSPIRQFMKRGDWAKVRAGYTVDSFVEEAPLYRYLDMRSKGYRAASKIERTGVSGGDYGSLYGQASFVIDPGAKFGVGKGVSAITYAATAGSATVKQAAGSTAGASIAPALAAADFIWERSYDYGYKDLFSLVSNGGSASGFYECACSKNDSDLKYEKGYYEANGLTQETKCDDAISWIAYRKYSDSGLTAAIGVGTALTVAFAPAGIAVTLATGGAAGAQIAYRAIRERVNRHYDKRVGKAKLIGDPVQLSDRVNLVMATLDDGKEGMPYLSPGPNARWEGLSKSGLHTMDGAECCFAGLNSLGQKTPIFGPGASKCGKATRSVKNRFLNLVSDRSFGTGQHHCRVCGRIYCGEHSSTTLPVLNPLKYGDGRRGDDWSNPYIGKIEGGQRVCTDCYSLALTESGVLNTYETGPERHIRTLITAATPRGTGDSGCKRAQAALFCLYHGNLKYVLASLVAKDGVAKAVSRAGIGVTKLPF